MRGPVHQAAGQASGARPAPSALRGNRTDCNEFALIIKGIKERAKEEKPYFPKGGALKITKSYLLLIVYAFAMTWLGFLITTPFATFALIYDLKGVSKVKPVPAVIISVLVTAGLYAMFVFGFQVKLPAGRLFE